MTVRTVDTNVAVYTVSPASGKDARAAEVLSQVDFVSVQLLNEFVHVARRRLRFDWPDVARGLAGIRTLVGTVSPITVPAHDDALWIASRYRLSFYDSLMLSVALIGGARVFYSEDMQDGLVIEDTLRIVNPFTNELA